jgi:hypothetical protein
LSVLYAEQDGRTLFLQNAPPLLFTYE